MSVTVKNRSMTYESKLRISGLPSRTGKVLIDIALIIILAGGSLCNFACVSLKLLGNNIGLNIRMDRKDLSNVSKLTKALVIIVGNLIAYASVRRISYRSKDGIRTDCHNAVINSLLAG